MHIPCIYSLEDDSSILLIGFVDDSNHKLLPNLVYGDQATFH